MGFKDSLVKIVGLGEIDEDEFVTEEELQAVNRREEKREERREDRASRRERRKNEDLEPTYLTTSSARHSSGSAQSYGGEAAYRSNPYRNLEKRLSMSGSASNSLKLILIEPKSFDECSKLVDSLKARKPIIINLENLERETAKKIFDFLNGATYALNGNVQKIANNIFIFTPENVSVAQEHETAGTPDGDGISRWG